MGDKINKIISIIKKDGIIKACGKIYRYINANYLSKINIIGYFYIKINHKKIEKDIQDILNGKYKRIIIWRSSFGWNVPLFQRPQHISKKFAENGCLVFYEVTTVTDKVKTYTKLKENLFLINFNNKAIQRILFEQLKKVKKPKYIQFYSTDSTISLQALKRYIRDGYKIIYEYIDDITPILSGTKEIPVNIKEKYDFIMNQNNDTFVVVTADELEKDVIEKRGREKLVFSCNGVDCDYIRNIDVNFKFEEEFNVILREKKPIIGYYGALASWFDYELLKYLATKRPEYNIVLFGIEYDESYKLSNLKDVKNIYFLGAKDYSVLKNYANKFDVCTIPFLINNITKATSPVKLFEYMALRKPIVTTEMNECKKYDSVMIAKDKEEFVKLIDYALTLNDKDNKDYFELLDKEANENSWEMKAKTIIDILKKYE